MADRASSYGDMNFPQRTRYIPVQAAMIVQRLNQHWVNLN